MQHELAQLVQRELAPDVRHAAVEHAALALDARIHPQRGQQPVAFQQASRIAKQQQRQLELARLQPDVLALVHHHLAAAPMNWYSPKPRSPTADAAACGCAAATRARAAPSRSRPPAAPRSRWWRRGARCPTAESTSASRSRCSALATRKIGRRSALHIEVSTGQALSSRSTISSSPNWLPCVTASQEVGAAVEARGACSPSGAAGRPMPAPGRRRSPPWPPGASRGWFFVWK
jgi:hypothetical protein